MSDPLPTPRIAWRFAPSSAATVPSGDQALAWLSAAERERRREFRIEKRRDDWTLGRLNLKALVAQVLHERLHLDVEPARVHVDRKPSGAPLVRVAADAAAIGPWEPGAVLPVLVANSHSHGHALAAAAWADQFECGPESRVGTSPVPGGRRDSWAALGVDLELVEPRSEGFVNDFLTAPERAVCGAAAGRDRDLRANLIWSAKESVLKVLQRGLSVDTWWLTCLPGFGNMQAPALQLQPGRPAWRPFAVTTDPRLDALVRRRVRFTGAWCEIDGFVLTIALGRE